MMSRPVTEKNYQGDGIYEENLILFSEGCWQGNCAWWTGEQCAVTAIAKSERQTINTVSPTINATTHESLDKIAEKLMAAGVIR